MRTCETPAADDQRQWGRATRRRARLPDRGAARPGRVPARLRL